MKNITKNKLDRIIDLIDESGRMMEEANTQILEITASGNDNMDEGVLNTIFSNRVAFDDIYSFKNKVLKFREERYGVRE